MVDVEKIKAEIEALRNINAEEYCREQVLRIYAEFEASKNAKIKDLETALAVFEQYQIVEEPKEEENKPEEVAEV